MKQDGFTLVEVIISISLGIALINLILLVYTVTIHTIALSNTLISMEDTAKRAIAILTTDIQKAGNLSCKRLKQHVFANNDNEIMVQYADPIDVLLLEDMHDNFHMKISNEIHFKKDEMLFVSNCSDAEIVEVADIKKSTLYQQISTKKPLKFRYKQNASVSRYMRNTYFVDKVASITALFMKNIQNNKTELISDISTLSFKYSVKKNNLIKELPANRIENWTNVVGVSVKIEVEKKLFKKSWYAYVPINA